MAGRFRHPWETQTGLEAPNFTLAQFWICSHLENTSVDERFSHSLLHKNKPYWKTPSLVFGWISVRMNVTRLMLWVKLPLIISASHVSQHRESSWSTSIQLLANVPGKAADGSSSVWAPATHGRSWQSPCLLASVCTSRSKISLCPLALYCYTINVILNSF